MCFESAQNAVAEFRRIKAVKSVCFIRASIKLMTNKLHCALNVSTATWALRHKVHVELDASSDAKFMTDHEKSHTPSVIS